MIKNILLIVMTIVSLMSFAFGFIQKLEADKQRELAVVIMTKAEQSKNEELKQKDRAFAAQAEADRQREVAMINEKRALECEKSKRK